MPKEPTVQTTAAQDAIKLHCQMCRQIATTRVVSIRQNIGMLYSRSTRTIEGELCRKCIRKYCVRYTAVNLVAGWWGVISFFVTPVFILTNLYEYCRTFGMKD